VFFRIHKSRYWKALTALALYVCTSQSLDMFSAQLCVVRDLGANSYNTLSLHSLFFKKYFFNCDTQALLKRWYIFKPKNPNLGKFWRALEWERLVYSLAIWNILRPFGYLVVT
jgi:hypothetical protein